MTNDRTTAPMAATPQAAPWLARAFIAIAVAALAIAAAHLTDAALAAAPVWVLYSRMDRDATLKNDTRRRIFDYVREMPGVCIADVATEVGVSHSTASYHLEKLLDFDMLTSTTDGNKVRFFINGGTFTEEERQLLAVLENPVTRRVLTLIAEAGRSYRAEISQILDVSPPTVNWHLERLMTCDTLRETRSGRNRFVRVASDVADAVARMLKKLEPTGYDTSGLERVLAALGGAEAPATNGSAAAASTSSH